jgi:hypothetical protein
VISIKRQIIFVSFCVEKNSEQLYSKCPSVTVSGVMGTVLAIGPEVSGFKPSRERLILMAIKCVTRLPSEAEVMPSVPRHKILRRVKEL